MLRLMLMLSLDIGYLYLSINSFTFSISKIESRPSTRSINPSAPWEYNLFLDITGSIRETSIENALKHLAEFADVQVLGSYPQFRAEAGAVSTSDAAAYLAQPIGIGFV
jgi:prephenate dehydratase